MKSNNRKTNTTDWVDKLSIYQTCMDHEQSIRTSYQSLLTTLEIALFGLVFVLIQLQWIDYLWVLAIVGVFLCLLFGIACEYRARNVDVWRTYIVKLVEKTDLEDAFKEGKYWAFPSRIKFVERFRGRWGHWFEEIIVPIILMMWLYVLWFFSSPLPVRLLGTLVTCIYIYYHLIELKWEYYWK